MQGTITALRANANDADSVELYIDHKLALKVGRDTLIREGLYTGKVLDEAAWDRLTQTEEVRKGIQVALRFLQARPRSTAEIRMRLKRDDLFTPDTIEAVLEKLQQNGLLDDADFSRRWVANRLAGNPRSRMLLRMELRQKGIADETIAETLADDELIGDERARAMEVARSVVHKYAGAPDRMTFERRLGGFLQRRGFSYDTIKPIMAELWKSGQRNEGDEEIG